MRILLLFVGCWLLSSFHVLGQNSKYTKIKAEENFEKNIPNNQKYQYPAFKNGTIAYNNGTVAAGKFNYNFLLDEIHFINPQGDTLSLADEYLLKMIVIQPDTFYYQSKIGYLQIVDYFKPINLAVKQGIKVLRNEKQSGYDQSSAVSAIRQYSYYTDLNGQIRKLEPKGNILLVKENSFFLIDKNSRVLPVTKVNLLSFYNSFRNKITAFMKANKINLNQEKDLLKLLEYCRGLAA
ncbi:hypothetical protein [Adhaeribacter radiodurans]|uniref:WG repeat-containing protein n=1 Tax=Adhaeribacter radiodurans TaxID=2745197 RepID=A0A7L7L3R5_9BACT|nr:hypothetical protein [Adhaeribacter radiodurans]QMU27413.1 hypothetical protein HUW48_04890 [Adhaeribacter radiodurans]